MHGHRARPGRATRGTVAAVLSAVLTAVGHVAGGGRVPDLAVLVVLVPLLATAFVAVADRCRTAVGTVVVLAAGQLVLHELMTFLHSAHSAATAAAVTGAPAMLTMHAAVTVVAAVALRHADHAVTALLRALGRVLPRRLAPPPADRPLRAAVVPGPHLPAVRAAALAVATPRRGPPVAC